MDLVTDVLVIGAGGAGMYAALSAGDAGAQVLLVDKNMIGRGGATIMAQMTVAAALGEAEPDTWEAHLEDTLAAGRGLCVEPLARLLCREAPARMRELDEWGVGWARADGHIEQVMAPGHSCQRCCYVDFLNTGPAVAGTLRKKVVRHDQVRRLSDVMITDLVVEGGEVRGAFGLDLQGRAVRIQASAVVIATGGLTKLYDRTSASNNMAGEGFALALRAGAALMDMEFVQFFPIGHLAPRLVGMDPIMWDPFRYKLGGRLLNGDMEEFIDRYGGEDGGKYTATRDLATYAIYQEVAAGRGTPHGGAYLSFAHVGEDGLRAAFGPVIDRLAENGIDLTRSPVEVAPIAHYHMGGIKVDVEMASDVPGLFAAGEAVGGASGANRLSGNAITEALVFGELAGRSAARRARENPPSGSARLGQPDRTAASPVDAKPQGDDVAAIARIASLKKLMWEQVGPFRDAERLTQAIAQIRTMHAALTANPPDLEADEGGFAIELWDWFEARAALEVAEAVAFSALHRRESRGAHQRDDFPDSSDAFGVNQVIWREAGELRSALAEQD